MEKLDQETLLIDPRIQQLSQLTVDIHQQSTLQEKLAIITRQVREIIGCHQSVTRMTANEAGGQEITEVSLSDKYARWREYAAPIDGSGIYSLICRFNKPMRLSQQELEQHPAWKGFGQHRGEHPPLRGWLAAPILGQGGSIGLIQLSDKYEGEFTAEDELILVQLAQIASISIENARLLERLQTALQEKEKAIKLTRTITDNATSALVMMDATGHCTYMNPAAEKMFGYSFEEIRQKPLHYQIHHHRPDGSHYPLEECPIDRALPENFDIRAHEDVFIRKDGTYFPVLCAASPIFEGGVPVSTVIEVRDVTEERRRQEEILEKIEWIRFLLDAMPQKVWTASANGSVDYMNKNWLSYTGIASEALLDWGWQQIIHPEDWELTRQKWQAAIDTGENFQIEHRFLRHDGEYRWHLSRGLAYKDSTTDTIILWVGTNTDIHDHKIALETVAKSNVELTRTNNDLDNFVYTASHDLKAPVMNIEGLLHALERVMKPKAGADKEVGMILDMIQQSIGRFKNTIGHLTEISKIQKNLEEDVTEVEFASLIREVLLSISKQVRDTRALIKVDTSGCEQLRFSQKDLHSIVFNLISNALKYHSPERKLEIEITTRQEGAYAVLSVKDNGLGFRQEQAEKVFSMFKRLHNHVEGSGVGLYIVKRIVDNAGGTIKVESEVDRGTHFQLYFKLATP
ncbi:PAS domain S-box protein [Cesiribacter andamanensis]|nr:PAS domain S-box protein [Cesiribacter andamanensis]